MTLQASRPAQAATPAPSVAGQGEAPATQMRAIAADIEARIVDAMAKREAVRAELINLPPGAPATVGRLEAQVRALDKNIADLQGSLGQVRTQIMVTEDAARRGVQVVRTSPPPGPRGMSNNDMTIAGVFTVFVLGPLAIAFAIRLVRRGWSGPAATPQIAEMSDRVRRIETAVEAMAIEVERVSESQRYLVRTLSDEAKLPLSKG